MKKLSSKTYKILGIIVVAIILVILAFSVYGLIKKIKDQEKVETAISMNIDSQEPVEEEMSIENLEEFVEEGSNNETNVANSKTSKTYTSNKSSNKGVSSYNKYYIKVNYGANVVTIYTKDVNGQYTPVKTMVCSTGTATPKSGTYAIKGRWRWLSLIGGVYGQYSTQIVGNILFHSVPYLRKGDPSSLEYWEYDKLGTSCSAGCIRLTVSDAKWIYNNIPAGTLVEFYSSSDPGPWGKPSAKKISGDDRRNWDPTDDDASNPWKTGVETNNEANDTNTNAGVDNTNTETNNENTDTNTSPNENANTDTNTEPNDNTNTNTDTNDNTTNDTGTDTNTTNDTNTSTETNREDDTNQN